MRYVGRFPQLLVLLFVAGSLNLLSQSALAQTSKFVPSETEWVLWPPYCKARYVDIPLGQSTEYADRISRQEIDAIETTLWPNTFRAIHHYCFGIGYMMRAKRASPIADPTTYNFLLRKVVIEVEFTFQRMELADPLAADVGYLLAQAHSMLDESDKAVEVLEKVIAAQPEMSGPYIALALLYRSENNLQKSLDTLELALNRVASVSAELYYTAAIAYIDADDLETAQRFATEAYKLGYPLPGLKNRLANLGYWPPSASNPDAQ